MKRQREQSEKCIHMLRNHSNVELTRKLSLNWLLHL